LIGKQCICGRKFNAIEAWDYDVEEEAGNLLVKAAKQKLNAFGIAKLFKANGFTKATANAAKIAESVIKQVQTIPTGYFEAKPARVVTFDEVRMVVAPDTMPVKLANMLVERGIPYTTYNGSETDRLEKLNAVEDVQFSKRISGYEKPTPKLSKRQYETFGWVRANNVLGKQAYKTLMEKYSKVYEGIEYAPESHDGYKIIESGDEFGVNKYIVLVKGSLSYPEINRIFSINYDEDTRIDYIRRMLADAIEESYTMENDAVGKFDALGLLTVANRLDYQTYRGYAKKYTNRNAGGNGKEPIWTYAKWAERNGYDNDLEEDVQDSRREVTISPSFQRWFQNSEVVDDDGEPLVVYHTTKDTFFTFDRELLGTSTNNNANDGYAVASAHVGFWFNTQPLDHTKLGDKVMPVYLSAQRLYEAGTLDGLINEIWDNYQQQGYDFDTEDPSVEQATEAGEEFTRHLASMGYDGISLNDREFGGKSFIVFEPEQIKSATDNVGTFDPDTQDIRYSRREVTGQVNMWDYMAELEAEAAQSGEEAAALTNYKRVMADLRKTITERNKYRTELNQAQTPQERGMALNRLGIATRQMDRAYDLLYKVMDSPAMKAIEQRSTAFVTEYKSGGQSSAQVLLRIRLSVWAGLLRTCYPCGFAGAEWGMTY